MTISTAAGPVTDGRDGVPGVEFGVEGREPDPPVPDPGVSTTGSRIRVLPVDPTVVAAVLVFVLVGDRAAVGAIRDGSTVGTVWDRGVVGVVRCSRVGATRIGATRIGVTALRRSGFGGDLTR